MRCRIFFILTMLLCGGMQWVFAQTESILSTERILNYDVDILVDTSSSILVTEKISVNALGHNIKHGIYRSLPTVRIIKNESLYVNYKVISVKKDGVVEPYTIKKGGNFDLYIGSDDEFVNPGIHLYEITYETYKQIGFWEGFDELYWNVTGNDWAFKIDNVSATVVLPAGADVLQNACYTGALNSKDQNCVSTLSGREITWQAENLEVNEGLTIAL